MSDVTKDLLKALKIVTSQLERVGDTRKHKDGEFIDLGREAIARAEAALAEADLDCPVCHGDCAGANPQPTFCPVETGADGWIPWAGGKCPVDPDALVRVRYADFLEEEGHRAGQYTWRHSNPHDPSDIIAYRVVKS